MKKENKEKNIITIPDGCFVAEIVQLVYIMDLVIRILMIEDIAIITTLILPVRKKRMF